MGPSHPPGITSQVTDKIIGTIVIGMSHLTYYNIIINKYNIPEYDIRRTNKLQPWCQWTNLNGKSKKHYHPTAWNLNGPLPPR